jgi:hypothetical protein
MAIAPARAQGHRFSGYDSPPGATAAVNLRVPGPLTSFAPNASPTTYLRQDNPEEMAEVFN